jgi:hypothetical protein
MEIDPGVLPRRRIILPRGHPWKRAHGVTTHGASQRTRIRCGHGPGSPSAVQVPRGLPSTGSLASAGAHRPTHHPGATPFWGMRATRGSQPHSGRTIQPFGGLLICRGAAPAKASSKVTQGKGKTPSSSNGRVLSRAGSGLVRGTVWSGMPWARSRSRCSGVNRGARKQHCRAVRVYSACPTWALRTLTWQLVIFAAGTCTWLLAAERTAQARPYVALTTEIEV